jgi:hypothetical protein
MAASRLATHDSGPGWLATPFLYDSFIHNSTPVCTGALRSLLVRKVHELYFTPQHQEFESRTMWSLSNAFTSAFKELDPIPQFRATARLGPFLETTSSTC